MFKRRHWIVLIACGIFTLAFLALALREREPSYQGRTLSQWLDPIHERGVRSESDTDPIRAIGTNAIPTILKWISYQSSPSREKIAALVGHLSTSLGQRIISGPEQRVQRAIGVFDVLGPDARAAIPELTRLALTSSDTNRAYRCIEALACIGPPALPTVLTLATNSPPTTREIAIILLPDFQDAEAMVSVIMHDLDSKDSAVLDLAAVILDHSDRYAVFSLLTNALHSSSAQVRVRAVKSIESLRLFASDVDPVLLPLLTDPEYAVRDVTTNALRQIAPGTLATP